MTVSTSSFVPRLNRKHFILVAYLTAFFVGCTAMTAAWDKVVVVFTKSVDARILWKTPAQTIERRDYILVSVSHSYIPERIPRVTKHALCLPGQTLSFDGLNFSCDGEWLHRVKPETASGYTLTPFAWTEGVVPEGMVYFGSSHPDGFDSRYLGFAALSSVTRLEVLV